MKSAAARTREAMAQHPHLREALAEGVLNIAATARFLDINGVDTTAVEAALRRMASTEVEAPIRSEPRVRIAQEIPPDSRNRQLETAREGDTVAVIVEPTDLAHHRAAIGRMGSRGIDLLGVVWTAEHATYVIQRSDLHRVIPALEQPVSEGVRRSIHSSATRDNLR